MLGGGGTGPGEAVSAGGRDGPLRRSDQRMGHRMRGHAHRDGITSERDRCRNLRVTFQHQSQRARPELGDQLSCQVRHCGCNLFKLCHLSDMDDDRVVGRAGFGFVNALNRVCIQGIRAQTVDRFSRESDQPTGP